MDPEPLIFAYRIVVAMLLGVAIGLERQFRQHPAGLRTNALVCVGAALFVSLSHLMNDDAKTRIASYIVSGIGFIGGGVILREGINIRGLATAATLWCSAAVGTLAGAGFPAHAVIGTVTILIAHMGLRPIARWIDARRHQAVDVETSYQMRVTCPESEEAVVRAILMRHVNGRPRMTVQGISSQVSEKEGHAVVVADIFSMERNDRAMEELLSRLNIEPDVTAVRWERIT
jgi:putative Mg2+ transporter-C (MgtC) family protein